ncbi:MAG: flagellar basal body rod protein FlgB [Candidatus Latescibacteria bacterium]|nr:flagellar basal body rod protein FlgB [bacterium]MBD3425244.1 flagellar basal body rod protein FlgB [Candidatus Latescibacterota bacterium]
MISDQFLARTGIERLRTALSAYSMRQKVSSQNIANIQTPGYQARNVSFEDNFNRVFSEGIRMASVQQPPGSIPITSGSRSSITVEKNGDDYFNGVNNVNLEEEMITQARANLSYSMVAKVTEGLITRISSAISGKVK